MQYFNPLLINVIVSLPLATYASQPIQEFAEKELQARKSIASLYMNAEARNPEVDSNGHHMDRLSQYTSDERGNPLTYRELLLFAQTKLPEYFEDWQVINHAMRFFSYPKLPEQVIHTVDFSGKNYQALQQASHHIKRALEHQVAEKGLIEGLKPRPSELERSVRDVLFDLEYALRILTSNAFVYVGRT